ncbi:MAG: ribonuclease D [Gemmatimonas sp.]
MLVVTDTPALAALCDRLASADFITVDTEFMRERTYWPKLCLVQLAGPDEAAVVDAQAPGIDLAPLFALMNDPRVLKVFHAARQDIEIFHHLTGTIPAPIFDTQVAAMVCGFGESVGYETLASKLARARIDKSMRFTDWSRRPLSEKQLHYALADVTHLRIAYEKLAHRLTETGRIDWVAEEMAVLSSPATYVTQPEDAWKRLRLRSANPRFLSVVRALAAWREREAQARDLPRSRVLRDEVLLDIAAQAPTNEDELARTRSVSRSGLAGWMKDGILAAVAEARAIPESELPRMPERRELPRGLGPVVDLLKVLLKMTSEAEDVAPRLIASSEDLEEIAANDGADVPALSGWRFDVFGRHAVRLKKGEVALAVKGREMLLVETGVGQTRAAAPARA